MGRAFEVSGVLHLTVDDHAIDVVADGSRVRAEIGDFGRGVRSVRLAASGLALARRLSRALDAGSLTLAVTRDGRTVAELGAGVRGGPLARILGISRVRIVRDVR